MEINEWVEIIKDIDNNTYNEILKTGYENLISQLNQNLFEDEFGLRTIILPVLCLFVIVVIKYQT